MNSYQLKNIFFDLDHTLWDFEANSTATLHEIFVIHQLHGYIASPEIFIKEYQLINKKLWNLYHQKLVDKETLRLSRFTLTLEKFNIRNAQLSLNLADDYVNISPHKGKLFPGVHEVLSALNKNFKLHLITNGFKEVQRTKVKSSNLEQYFDHIFISEEIGFIKPQPEIFNHAIKMANTLNKECIMVGDNYEADILGAAAVGIATVYFNPEKIPNDYEATYQISALNELISLLL